MSLETIFFQFRRSGASKLSLFCTLTCLNNCCLKKPTNKQTSNTMKTPIKFYFSSKADNWRDIICCYKEISFVSALVYLLLSDLIVTHSMFAVWLCTKWTLSHKHESIQKSKLTPVSRQDFSLVHCCIFKDKGRHLPPQSAQVQPCRTFSPCCLSLLSLSKFSKNIFLIKDLFSQGPFQSSCQI